VSFIFSDECIATHRITVEIEGVWFAFWLLPKAPFTWPGDGEIDICEGWDGISESGACLHWGHFNGEDWDKHRVQKRTFSGDCHHYGFAWDCKEKKLLWFTDGRPTMKAAIPKGIRDMKEFQILLNVAQGGNVMQSAPDMPSSSEMIVTDLKMYKEIPGGWKHFKSLYKSAKEGATM
jgi:beta-glucanase (GH16 family)